MQGDPVSLGSVAVCCKAQGTRAAGCGQGLLSSFTAETLGKSGSVSISQESSNRLQSLWTGNHAAGCMACTLARTCHSWEHSWRRMQEDCMFEPKPRQLKCLRPMLKSGEKIKRLGI